MGAEISGSLSRFAMRSGKRLGKSTAMELIVASDEGAGQRSGGQIDQPASASGFEKMLA
jgi:hypothetical protein